MPEFTYKSCGVNRDGNHYCARDYGNDVRNTNSYHYSNADGSYYYSNLNGSTYYNDGQGSSVYTSPGGLRYYSGYGEGSRQDSKK